MKQLPLLSKSPIARKTDPITSKISAKEITKSGKRATQQHIILRLVNGYPNKTSRELSAIVPFLSNTDMTLDRYQLARRLPELENAGLIKKGDAKICSISGRLCVTWHS